MALTTRHVALNWGAPIIAAAAGNVARIRPQLLLSCADTVMVSGAAPFDPNVSGPYSIVRSPDNKILGHHGSTGVHDGCSKEQIPTNK
jgi:hypothetical protein